MYEGTRATKKITKKPMAFGWTLASLISARSCSPLVHCAAFAQTLMAALKLMPDPWMTSYLRTFSGHQASKRQRDCLRLSASRPLSWLHPLGPRSIVFYGADTKHLLPLEAQGPARGSLFGHHPTTTNQFGAVQKVICRHDLRGNVGSIHPKT